MRSTTISGRCWRRAASRASQYTRPRRSSSTLAGRNVVVVTPTASEKTLCYNVPVLSAMLDQPATRALYLFPTKALAQDQLAELHELTDGLRTHGHDIGAYTYDGDTPQDAHRAIRGRAHLVLSNPEMLHLGILPNHPRWVKLFENLRYIAIDELHAYRGVFGSHLANILRRLQRICRHYGSAQRFICSSATIANPRELAERLTEEPFSLVNRSGAPRGEKQFVIVNPPVVSPQLGIRRSYLSEARRLALEFLRRQLQIIVFTQSRLATEILTTYLKDGCRGLPGGAAGIRGYRGGYLPLRRWEIERGLRDGAVSGVVSTNALELGIDIGFLDVCFMAEVDWDYYTDAIAYIKVTILGKFDADDAALTSGRAVVVRSHGEVHVVTRVVGFKKIKFYTGENVWAGDLDLPEQQMHTSAYWLTVPRELYAKLPHPPAERRDGVAGVGITLRGMAQLLLMCGRHDIGLAIHGDEGRGPVVTDEPHLHLRRLSRGHRLQ